MATSARLNLEGHDTLPPLHNLSLSNKLLIKQVASAKNELEQHFQRYHRMLYDKQQLLLSQLDNILLSANELYKKRAELKQAQEEMEEKFTRNEFHDMKIKMLEPLVTELSELERRIIESEREIVELEWKDVELEAVIQQSCAVLKRDPVVVVTSNTTPAVNTSISYPDRQIPVWSVGSWGTGEGQIDGARGLAIDPESGDIYLADMKNNRIVIFDKDGQFQRNMKIDGLSKPWTVLITAKFCFIACDILSNEGLIMKVNKKTGEKLAIMKHGVALVALSFDKETEMLFGCPLSKASILYFQQENLMKVSAVELKTPNFTNGTTQIYDMLIESFNKEIFILFRKSTFPLQSFSRDGNLLRSIMPAEMIKEAFFFTVDSHCNFIISDYWGHNLKIFSSTGMLIAVIGKDKTEKRSPGELYTPRGIALARNGHIVVCDGKGKNTLQMF